MKQKLNSREGGGMIQYIIIIIAGLILIAYFRDPIQKFLDSPGVKDALLTAIGWVSNALGWVLGKLNWTAGQIK